MAAERKVIDIDDDLDFIRLVEQVRESREVAVLRRDGEAIAEIRPIRHRGRRPRREVTREDIDAFLASAGGWKGLVDGDQLIADIYADRDAEIDRSVDE